MADEPSKVVQSSRQVIEHRLLTALEEDPSAVAVLLAAPDVDLLVRALRAVSTRSDDERRRRWTLELGLRQLRREAFGE